MILIGTAHAQNFSAKQKHMKLQKRTAKAETSERGWVTVGAGKIVAARGPEAFSPFAPKDAGSAEAVVTQPIQSRGQAAPNDDRKPYGGITLIGWDF